MKKGDKIRFLNEVGGGIVTGFQGKDIVLVEDKDGFDIPVKINECVVIEMDNYNLERKSTTPTPTPNSTSSEMPHTSIKAALKTEHPSPDHDASERPITFKPAPMERRGGDTLNIYLCFVPTEVTQLSQTTFDTYLVNDSNYSLYFTYLTGENKSWQLRFHGQAEPNTKIFIETLESSQLNDIQNICFQLMAFKENKPFLLKASHSVEIHMDLTRFYKLHTFASNDFFAERVLTVNIVNNDQALRQRFDAHAAIREHESRSTLVEKQESSTPHIHAIAVKKEKKDDIKVVDLHAAELLDNTRGMRPGDILEYQLDVFRKTMNQHLKEKGHKIVFIHGKGQGVLRNAILRELSHKYKTCTNQDASFREYGFGATLVTIH